jgi:hypothetical protein
MKRRKDCQSPIRLSGTWLNVGRSLSRPRNFERDTMSELLKGANADAVQWQRLRIARENQVGH